MPRSQKVVRVVHNAAGKQEVGSNLPGVQLRAVQQAQVIQLGSVLLHHRWMFGHRLIGDRQRDGGVVQLVVPVPAYVSHASRNLASWLGLTG